MIRWTRDEIAMEILGLYGAGEDLNYSTAAVAHPTLLRAATRHFGSWRSAIEFAGLDYNAIRRYRTWTRSRILSRIQALHGDGADLSWRNVSTRLDPQLAAAATKPSRFGSWRAAIEAAGLNYDEIRRYRDWDEERILQEVRELAADGRPLSSKDIQDWDVGLFHAAIRRFRTWDECLQAAGLDATEIRRRPPFERRPRRRPAI